MEKKRMKYRQRQNFFKTDAWKRFRKNKLALVGTAVILLLILVAVFAPVIAQNDPYVSKNQIRDFETDRRLREPG